MRSFKGSQNFTPSATHQQMYSPSRTTQQRQMLNTTDNPKNKNRTQQIVLLHQQFQDLKRKIKQVQNKNQKIIQKIHRECNFKKKTPQTIDMNADTYTAPIVYYQKKDKSLVSQNSAMSDKSDQSEFQFRQKRNVQQRGSVQSSKHIVDNMGKKFAQSIQYTRGQVGQLQREQGRRKYPKLSSQNYDDDLEESVHSHQIIGVEFEEEQGYGVKNSHQTYSHFKDYRESGGKKGNGGGSFPASQQHVGYGQGQQEMRQSFTPQMSQHQQESRSSHQTTPNSQSQLFIYQLEQSLKIQKQKITYLQSQLKQRQLQIMTAKKDYNKLTNQFQSVQMMLQQQLQRFMQTVVKKGFFQMQKQVKKSENRLRNIAINVKDQFQEIKSSRLIKEHQLRRSNSRSRRDLSPLNHSSINTFTATGHGQQVRIPRPGSSHGTGFFPQQVVPQNLQPSHTSLNPNDKRSRISEQQSKKNKEFEQIVQKYEQMINSKREEISKLQSIKSTVERKNTTLQKQLQSKQSQVKDMKQKLDELQKLMSDAYNEVPINSKMNKGKHRLSSVQSNLLQDIEHEHYDRESEVISTRFQLMYLQTKQELSEKLDKISHLQELIKDYESRTVTNEEMIKDYQVKISVYEGRIAKLESSKYSEQSKKLTTSTSSMLDRIAKEKIEDGVRRHMEELHRIEITHKDSEIQQFRTMVNGLQKRLVQKDCELVSLGNKVKKVQGVNEIYLRKVEEYEKMLSSYHHNTSVDVGGGQGQLLGLLDSSVCHEGNNDELGRSPVKNDDEGRRSTRGSSASRQSVTMSVSEFESLESQLKEMSQQILQLTKRLKVSEKLCNEKAVQCERLVEESEQCGRQNQKLGQEKKQLKMKVKQLEENLVELNEDRSEVYNEYDDDNRMGFSLDERKSEDQASGKRGQQKWTQQGNLSSDMGGNSFSQVVEQRKSSNDDQTHYQNAHLIESTKRLQDQLSVLKVRNLEISTQYNNLKSQHLQLSRASISLRKDNQYLAESLADREQKYQRCRRESEELKVRNNQLVEVCQRKEEELKREKVENCAKIQELEKQWHQFEQEINNNNNPDNLYASVTPSKKMQSSELLKSSRYNISQSSILLSSTLYNKNSQYLQQQNQYLTIKLKQAQATIQVHNMMQQKVLDQYKTNVDKLKVQIKEKNKQTEMLKVQLQTVNDAKRRLEVLYESSRNYLAESRMTSNLVRKRIPSQCSYKKPVDEEVQKKVQLQSLKDIDMEEFASYNDDSNNLSMISAQQQQHEITNQQQRLYPYQRILELQGQLKQAKDINKKLQQMQEQLFKQIRLKEQEKKDLIKMIDDKNMKIQQLQEIVQLKQHNSNSHNVSHLGSNILGSSSNYKSSSQNKNNLSQRQSMHSHSTLRYSAITHAKYPNNPTSSNNLQVMNASQMGTSQRFEIQLSETGSEMLDKSYVTNISEIFQKEEFPYQKVQLKRKQQVKLFQKTASYIKSLKDSINEKNKRIKLLEKKIDSLKNNHHGPLSKQLENKYEISTKANDQNNLDLEVDCVFKDYESVQLQRKKASHNKRFKNLQHEWKLAIEENNVLSNQVEVLQEELEKAEQQENSILVMKDLYKEEIKKLLAKNESLTTYYEDLVAKEKRKVQQSQSVHNLETIKQLFLKVMDAIIVMESEKSKKKREEKKKQLEQYFKIFASLCAVEEAKKNAILEGIRKMTMNIVLAEEGRGSSATKHKE